MGYYLLDHPNPNGSNFYTTRSLALTAITMHVTAGLEDLDTVDDHSAENTAAYAASTDREVSWHSGSDADSFLYLLPPGYTAWHATSYNSSTYGHEISKKHTDWRVMSPNWVEKTLRNAAKCLAPIVRQYGIPIRKATRAEVDHARVTGVPAGFISHAELQPEDRRDPGWVSGVDTFPWQQFLNYVKQYVTGEVPVEEEEMGYAAYQVQLPPTDPESPDSKEVDVLIPWRDSDGGQNGVQRVTCTLQVPAQPLVDVNDPSKGEHTFDVQFAHWIIQKADGVRTVVPFLADGTELRSHEDSGGKVAPDRAKKLTLVYRAPAGGNVLVEVNTK